MVTVLVLIRVAVPRTNRSPLKGPAGITILPASPRDLRSATVTSNYGRAVTILPTLVTVPLYTAVVLRTATIHFSATAEWSAQQKGIWRQRLWDAICISYR
jgi:hypothetical protein